MEIAFDDFTFVRSPIKGVYFLYYKGKVVMNITVESDDKLSFIICRDLLNSIVIREVKTNV